MMDPNLLRLEIAQELIQTLANALMIPVRQPHSAIQAMLDAATAKLKAIDAQANIPATPLVFPQLVPATPVS